MDKYNYWASYEPIPEGEPKVKAYLCDVQQGIAESLGFTCDRWGYCMLTKTEHSAINELALEKFYSKC